jgi:U1 small nuclear ribonucleoprotein
MLQIGQSHPTGLTTNLLKLFEPRAPLEFKPPPEKRKCPPYQGIGQFVNNFAEPGDPEYAPPVTKGETPTQRRARIHMLRLEEGAKKALEELEKCMYFDLATSRAMFSLLLSYLLGVL